MLLMAIPILLMDTIIGQYTRRGPVHAFRDMFPLFQGLGYAAIITAAVLSTSYNMIMGWTVYYMAESFSQKWTQCNNSFNTPNCTTVEEARLHPNESATKTISTEEFFNYYVLNKADSIYGWSWPQPGLTLSLFVVTGLVVLSLSNGVKSTGKVVYFTATFPYVMLIALFFRGITLEGAGTGISFYLTPNFSKLLELGVWMDALIAGFFSLGIGMGCMIVYGSYNRFHNKLVRDVIIVISGDMLTSFFAGFVIFSMVGYVSHTLGRQVQDIVENGR
ncbi:Sodium- and chloride-dependent glycine transporter 2-like protein, partial [Leptotrombidium deliense]